MKDKQRVSDLRALTEDQLNDEVLKLKKEQFNMRFQRATGQLSRPDQFDKVRKNIARIKTLLGESARKNGLGESARQKGTGESARQKKAGSAA